MLSLKGHFNPQDTFSNYKQSEGESGSEIVKLDAQHYDFPVIKTFFNKISSKGFGDEIELYRILLTVAEHSHNEDVLVVSDAQMS